MASRKRKRKAFDVALEKTATRETLAGSEVVRPNPSDLRETKEAAFRKALEEAKRNQKRS